eukprot:1149513-Pelagomonas_calceolata.AAC.3
MGKAIARGAQVRDKEEKGSKYVVKTSCTSKRKHTYTPAEARRNWGDVAPCLLAHAQGALEQHWADHGGRPAYMGFQQGGKAGDKNRSRILGSVLVEQLMTVAGIKFRGSICSKLGMKNGDHVLIEASGRAMLKRGAGVQRASRGASWNALLDGNAPVLALQLQVL